MPYYPGGEQEKGHYETKTKGKRLVIAYTGLNLYQINYMDLDMYLFYMREAYIHNLMQTKEGREYLDNCWRMTQTKPERQKLREKYAKEGQGGKK